MSDSRRTFAIIPAAGVSRRMGQPKLLLPCSGRPLIDFVLEAWTRSSVDRVVLVTRRGDTELHAVCQKWPIELVLPDLDPQDMKASLQAGLDHIEADHAPTAVDCWMVAPADVPGLTPRIIDQLIGSHRPERVVAPSYDGRRGHPVMLPWTLAPQLSQLADDEGLDRILDRAEVDLIAFPSSERPADVDTPEDYRRLLDAMTNDRREG